MSNERLHSKNFVTPCLCLFILEKEIHDVNVVSIKYDLCQ